MCEELIARGSFVAVRAVLRCGGFMHHQAAMDDPSRLLSTRLMVPFRSRSVAPALNTSVSQTDGATRAESVVLPDFEPLRVWYFVPKPAVPGVWQVRPHGAQEGRPTFDPL